MINYSLILSINYQNDHWSILGNDYETFNWFSETPKPTQNELDALWSSTVETQAKNYCLTQAKQILKDTDWTSITDVGDSAKSNPYLINQSEFIAYRSIVRNYAVNPVTNPTFPSTPIEQWSA